MTCGRESKLSTRSYIMDLDTQEFKSVWNQVWNSWEIVEK